MRETLSRASLFLAGLLILLSAFLHGLVNVPHLHEDLVEIGVRPTLLGAVMLVLYFSVVAMFAFGLLVLWNAGSALRGRPLQLAPLWIIAATYVAFGIAAFVLVSPTHHVLGYAVMGVLVAGGAALRPAPVGTPIL